MPYYTVSDGYGLGSPTAYNAVVIALLRDDYGYDGVLCTDWGITGDPRRPSTRSASAPTASNT